MVIAGVLRESERADGGFDLGFGITGGASFEHGEGVFDGEGAVEEVFGDVGLFEEGEVKSGETVGKGGDRGIIGGGLVVIRAITILNEHESGGGTSDAEGEDDDEANDEELLVWLLGLRGG